MYRRYTQLTKFFKGSNPAKPKDVNYFILRIQEMVCEDSSRQEGQRASTRRGSTGGENREKYQMRAKKGRTVQFFATPLRKCCYGSAP